MTYEQFFKELKAGQLRPAYLFHGAEQLVKQTALEQLQKSCCPPDWRRSTTISSTLTPARATSSRRPKRCP